MKLFTKIFLFMFISFIVVVFSISYFVTLEQISNAKKNVLQEYTTLGSFLSEEIEVGYFESHWPFESLNKLSEYKGFLFWWIVDDKGVIHLANNASFIRTVAKKYFPEIELKQKQAISLNLDKNYGIFFKTLNKGKNKWSFWYGFSLDKISERKKDIILLITTISISALLVVGITLFFGIKYIMRPIKSLSIGASVIGEGNLTHRVKIESQDELGDLAQSFNKMADDLQKSYASLQESEGKFRELAEFLPQPVFEIDISSNFIYSNRCGLETFGYTLDDLEKGVNALQLFIPEERDRVRQNIQKRLSGEDFEDHEYTGLRKDGSTFPIFIYSAPIMHNDKAVGVRGIVLDISESKIVEEALRESEQKYRELFENASIGIGIANEKGEIIDFNDAMLKPGGYCREDITKINNVLELYYNPEARSKVLALIQKQGFADEVEVQFKRKDGTPYDALLSLRAVRIKGESYLQAMVQDITDRKYAEEQLKASLKEKEILLREIHHRVKNNLSVISSLLSMQANTVTDRGVHSALQESQSRVKAMSLIHETLYQSESLASVDLERYVKDLISNIANAYDGISNRIKFEVEVKDVKLEVNQAIPCGLIINELATNALKHAFADEQHGVVRITARYTEKSEVQLVVSDNGTGFSEELDWKKSKSLGLRLISLMVDQLHGNMNIKNHHGAEIAIKWPVQFR